MVVTTDRLRAPMDRSGGRPAARPRARWLALAQAAWAGLVLLALGIFMVAIPALYARRSTPPELIATGLAELGIPVGFYATYWTGIHILFAVVYFAAAAMIVRHRSNDLMALFVSLFLVLLGGANAPLTEALIWRYPATAAPITLVFSLTATCLVLFFFVFPDGRFAPRWTRLPLAVWAALFLLTFLVPSVTADEAALFWPVLILFIGLGAGMAAQVYRYARVSSPTQRRQTRWVLVSAAVAIVGQVVGMLLSEPLPPLTFAPSEAVVRDLASVTVIVVSFLAIPLSIGVAVSRHRLWDVDLVINRALVYSALTACVVVIHVLVVGSLGVLIQTTGNPVVGLLATGVAAVLFQPLRDRLQRGVDRLMYGERAEPYQVLSRLGRRLEVTLAAEAILPAILQSVREALKLPYAAIALERGGPPVIVASSGAPVANPFRLPLTHHGEAIGELLLGARAGEETLSDADRRLLEDLARQASVAVHAVRLTEDLQRSREQLVTAHEEERRRLRRDLHDGLGPRLASLTLRLETARDRLARDPEAEALLADLAERTRQTVADVRRLVYLLRPPALDDLGLVSALREQAVQYGYEGSGLEIVVEAPETLPPLPAAVEVAAYRIAQEALTNVVRHAGARHCIVRLTLEKASDLLCVDVEDDGRGLEPDRRAGVGLASMRERAEELGGTWSIECRLAGGTRVRAWLPCRRVDPDGPGT